MDLRSPRLRERLSHVYWLGGGPGGGKSTMAGRLARDCGLRVYSTDDAMADHARRSSADDSPHLAEFIVMDMDERWVRRPPTTMLETFHWFRGESFDLIVEDLLDLPREPVVVEGFRLLPHLVQPLAGPQRAVWLLPSPTFRRTAHESRGSLWTIAGRTSDPELALSNLLARDALFIERLAVETRRLGLPAIEVDLGTGVEDLLNRVRDAFGLEDPI